MMRFYRPQILTAKRADAGADTSALARRAEAIAKAEAEIDRQVCALYLPAPRFVLLARQAGGLTPAEIKLVEESAAPKASVT